MIKFMYNGLKVDGVLYKASYSIGPYTEQSKLPKGTITMYANRRFPKVAGLTIENNSDIMTDYFENDKFRIMPGNPYYGDAKAAYEKQEIHHRKIWKTA